MYVWFSQTSIIVAYPSYASSSSELHGFLILQHGNILNVRNYVYVCDWKFAITPNSTNNAFIEPEFDMHVWIALTFIVLSTCI